MRWSFHTGALATNTFHPLFSTYVKKAKHKNHSFWLKNHQTHTHNCGGGDDFLPNRFLHDLSPWRPKNRLILFFASTGLVHTVRQSNQCSLAVCVWGGRCRCNKTRYHSLSIFAQLLMTFPLLLLYYNIVHECCAAKTLLPTAHHPERNLPTRVEEIFCTF